MGRPAGNGTWPYVSASIPLSPSRAEYRCNRGSGCPVIITEDLIDRDTLKAEEERAEQRESPTPNRGDTKPNPVNLVERQFCELKAKN